MRTVAEDNERAKVPRTRFSDIAPKYELRGIEDTRDENWVRENHEKRDSPNLDGWNGRDRIRSRSSEGRDPSVS